MYRFHISTISFLLLSIQLWAQEEDVTKLTNSIIQNSNTELEQVRDIYNWITHNIDYDVKRFRKLDYTPLTISEILKKRKAGCTAYSMMVNAMCNSIGIESYTIHGYSKGYHYYPNKPFIRGNHTWNAVFADSNWIILDATWGSGYLKNTPRFINKTIHLASLKKKALINDKIVFVNAPNVNYFNISTEELPQNNYPLDPKWLLSESPISYTHFEADSGGYTEYPNYLNEIERIRHKEAENQYKIEGIRAEKDNSLNSYDLATGYMNIAQHYDIHQEITSDNLWQFEKYFNEFTLIYEASLRYRNTIDSIYKERFSYLKNFSRTQKRLTDKVKAKSKSEEKSFKSSQKQFHGKNASYTKRISTYMLNIKRAELKVLDEEVSSTQTIIDSAKYIVLTKEIKEIKEQEISLKTKEDSISQLLIEKIKIAQTINDSIKNNNLQFNTKLVLFNKIILSDNEGDIRAFSNSIQKDYKNILDLIETKKGAKKDIDHTSSNYYTESSLLQNLLKKHLNLLQELYEISGYSQSVKAEYDFVNKQLKNSYQNAIEYTKIASGYNIGLEANKEQNLLTLKKQRKNIVKDYLYFLGWYKKNYDWEKNTYASEKRMISNIRSQSLKSLKKVELKIEKHKTKHEENVEYVGDKAKLTEEI